MVARRLLALLLAVLLLSSSGCCWLRRVLCDECCSGCETGAFTFFAGRSCGEAYWSDWHSHPPKCDPCDGCGYAIDSCECGVPHRVSRPAGAMMTVGADCESCGGA
jgi:hypothetical protein